jgi:hypothetical protein
VGYRAEESSEVAEGGMALTRDFCNIRF